MRSATIICAAIAIQREIIETQSKNELINLEVHQICFLPHNLQNNHYQKTPLYGNESKVPVTEIGDIYLLQLLLFLQTLTNSNTSRSATSWPWKHTHPMVWQRRAALSIPSLCPHTTSSSATSPPSPPCQDHPPPSMSPIPPSALFK